MTKQPNPANGLRDADASASAGPLQPGPANPSSALSLEEALAALDEILAALETGDVALDEAIRLYERGVLLAKEADQQLSAAELRVQQIDVG